MGSSATVVAVAASVGASVALAVLRWRCGRSFCRCLSSTGCFGGYCGSHLGRCRRRGCRFRRHRSRSSRLGRSYSSACSSRRCCGGSASVAAVVAVAASVGASVALAASVGAVVAARLGRHSGRGRRFCRCLSSTGCLCGYAVALGLLAAAVAVCCATSISCVAVAL